MLSTVCKMSSWAGLYTCPPSIPQFTKSPVEEKFVSHLSEYGLSFATDEEFQFRLSLFAKTEESIYEINARETDF